MSAQAPFHVILKQERERAGLSLRGLADKAKQNPGSISRMEAGTLTPRLPILLAIATAIAQAQTETVPRQEHIVVRLLNAAGRMPAGALTADDIRARFEQRVRDEGIDEQNVALTLASVDFATMVRVATGVERLRARRPSEIGNLEDELEPNEQVVVLADRDREFRAGPRAKIVVAGALTAQQIEQVRLLSTLLTTLLDTPGEPTTA